MGDRFIELYNQAGFFKLLEVRIIADRVTGVQYLAAYNGNQIASITPLLDAEGKPVLYTGE